MGKLSEEIQIEDKRVERLNLEATRFRFFSLAVLLSVAICHCEDVWKTSEAIR